MFDPQINQSITIDKEVYLFMEHPNALNMAYAQEGKKALVYKIKQKIGGKYFALKVFKPIHQDPKLVSISDSLVQFGNIEGMKVCKRTCITPKNNPELIKNFPELNYSLLMPWAEGKTWFDILQTKEEIPLETSLKIASKLLELLVTLERNGYAHCDISSANLILDCEIKNNKIIFQENPQVELIDVEDMFGPNFSDPNTYPLGTDGYHHKTSRIAPKGQWCKEGDRFAAAIILAELMCWSDLNFRNKASNESYFSLDDLNNKQDISKHQLLTSILNNIGTPLKTCFETAWNSNNLSYCPSITEWQQALISSLNSIAPLRKQLKKVIKQGLDKEVIRLSKEIRRNNYPLSKSEWKAYSQSHRKVMAQERLDQELLNGNETKVLSAYDPLALQSLEQADNNQINVILDRTQRWLNIKRAVRENDDEAISELYDSAILGQSNLISKTDREKIEQALHRMALVKKLHSTFITNDPYKILNSYPEDLLQHSNLLTYNDHQIIENARREIDKAQSTLLVALSIDPNPIHTLPNDEQEIIKLWLRGLINANLLASDADRQRLTLVIRELGRVFRIERTLRQKDVRKVRRLYGSGNIAQTRLLTRGLREQVENLLSENSS